MTTPDNRTPEQIRADIVARREALTATVEQLQYKLDVKARGAEKLAPYQQYVKPAAAAVGALVAVLIVRRVRNRS